MNIRRKKQAAFLAPAMGLTALVSLAIALTAGQGTGAHGPDEW